MMDRSNWKVLASTVAAGALCVGALFAGPMNQSADDNKTSLVAERAIEFADELSIAFERVANIIQPSVVSITSLKRVQGPQMIFPQIPDEQLREFFGDQAPFDFFRRFEGPDGGQPRLQQGQGSGFIVSDDGYIITNNHVVSDADEVTVILSDDRRYVAEVIGADAQTDIALIRIEAEGLTPVKFGDSEDLRVGQWVVAAGNPFGLSSSITAGIVSATGRAGMHITDYEDFIQTDAAINPGNSGGPLVNLRGEVVGVNTFIMTRSGGNLGIGFAIPVNLARSIMLDLKDDGEVERGFLGVYIQDLDQGLAESFGFEGTAGVLISDLAAEGPADKAGLERGDIVTEIDDQPVSTKDKLKIMVAETDPGETVEFTIFRDGKTKKIPVTIGELDSEQVAARGRQAPSAAETTLGMMVQAVTPELANRFNLERGVEGALVTDVEPFSIAARAGLGPGDLIVQVGDEEVTGPGDFRDAIRNRDLSRGVRLVVRTEGVDHYVFLRQVN